MDVGGESMFVSTSTPIILQVTGGPGTHHSAHPPTKHCERELELNKSILYCKRHTLPKAAKSAALKQRVGGSLSCGRAFTMTLLCSTCNTRRKLGCDFHGYV